MADPSRKRKMDVPGAGGPSKRTVEESAAALAAELEMDGDVLEVEFAPDDVRRCITRTAQAPGCAPGTSPPLSACWPPKGVDKPAKEYKFKLDPFQAAACNSLERRESVLVAAHTSAGKTVVAEYAIAMALRDKQRVVYTSPLKALSNQKYRELQETFTDVGLMTGDIVINPSATCLVMTTEVLRSMLYRGAEVVREVAWLIYDEVHYLRDPERGVVWEESIVMAPKGARFAFLSATLPNAFEFARWIAKSHAMPCHVVYTDYRPTPLQHYVFPAGGDALLLVVDEKGVFRDKNFQQAVKVVSQSGAAASASKAMRDEKWGKSGQGQGQAEESDIYKVVDMCMQKNLDPVIVFDFSKRNCEKLSHQMDPLDLTSDSEKDLIDGVFNNAIDMLCEDDKRLPQVANLLPRLRRGVGVHHSGLLPIMKEVIEILFQEGLIRVLFATETFSTGLNMPAKCVIFTSVRKFDGGVFRWVSGGEYIQMSGRAGRRGLDDKGVVILMLDERLEPEVAKGMVKGKADVLHSAFHLSYNMVLNLCRIEGIKPEDLLKKSFRQFQAETSVPALESKVALLEARTSTLAIEDEDCVEEYANLQAQLRLLQLEKRALVHTPTNAIPFLQPGRLIRVTCLLPQPPAIQSDAAEEDAANQHPAEEKLAWGVVVAFTRVGSNEGKKTGPQATAGADSDFVTVDVLMNCIVESGVGKKKSYPVPHDEADGEPRVVTLPLDRVESLSKLRINMHKDLKSRDNRMASVRVVGEVHKRFKGEVPVLDPEDDYKLRDSGFRKVVRRIETVEGMLERHKLAKAADRHERLRQLRLKAGIQASIKASRKAVKAAGSMILKDELRARRRVLHKMDYLDAEHVVQTKGHVACEISTSDEIVVTELMFSGILKTMTVEQTVALVSCLVWTEKDVAVVKQKSDMEGPLRTLRDITRKTAKLMSECKMDIDLEEYVDSFQTGLVDATRAWCRGAKFAEIKKMVPDVFEGSLVRAMRRLEELLGQMAAAAKLIGDQDLEAHLNSGREKLKRDIVFAASLYL